MFSELALGNFGPDGALNIDRNISLYDNVRTKSPTARCKLTSAASCPVFTRQRSTVTISSYAQSEAKLNELILPKTYITRKGDLLLFAVIDNELFALVDSANKSAKKPKESNNDFGIKPEMLSQYGSLEDFVLAVLEYKHKKEKYLYASATRKLSQFIKRRKYIGRTERNAVFENQRSSREPEAHIKNFLTPKDVDHEARYNDSNSEVSTGRSVQISVKDDDDEESNHKLHVENKQDFDRLALPGKHSSKVSGRLRSPLLERKANAQRVNTEQGDKEYLNFSIKMDQQALDGPAMASIINNNRKLLDKLTIEQKKEFLFSINGFFQQNNSQNSTDSFKETSHLPENIKKTSGYLKHVDASGLSSKVVTNGISQAPGKNTILPFVFDGRPAMKSGRPVVKGLRQSSAIQSFNIRKSVSNQDLRNLRFGTSSARSIPEKRALGVTPSAISLNSENLSHMLEYNANNQFTLKLSNNDNKLSSTTGLETFLVDQCQRLDQLENLQASADLLREKFDSQYMDDFDPVLQHGALLAITQANKKLGIEPHGNEVPDRLGSHRDSKSPSIFRGIEDDDDNILFSYISPGLRRGSWNPTLSVSFDSLSRENSKAEDCSRENTFSRVASNRRTEACLEEAQMEHEAVFTDANSQLSSAKGISNKENDVSLDNISTTSQKGYHSHKVLDNAGFVDESEQDQRHLSQMLVTENGLCSPSSLFFTGEDETLHEMRRRRSLSPKSDKNRNKTTPKNRNTSGRTTGCLSGERNYEQELIDGTQGIVKVVDKVERQQERRSRHSPHSLRIDESSDTTRTQTERPDNRTDNLQREFPSYDGESVFSSHTGTNISIRDSVADERNLADRVIHAAKEFFNVSSYTINDEEMQNEQPVVSIGSEACNDKSVFENSYETRLLNDTACNEDVKQPANSSTEVKERLQENMVTTGLLNQQISKARTNPIIEDFAENQQSLYLDEGVFAAKQLLDTEIEAHSTQVMNKSHSMPSNDNASQQFTNGYKATTEDEPIVSTVQKIAEDTANMSSFLKPGREKGQDKNAKRIGKKTAEKPEKQTMELKIDLKVAEDSSPDNISSDTRKSLQSLQSNERDAANADKSPLRLDGVGGNEGKDQTTLEELKSLLQPNRTTEDLAKAKKKQGDKAPMKRAVSKQRKKKNIPSRQNSISKKAADSKNLSPVLDLPKKMETVETMIGRPKQSENLMKPSPDTEPEAAIEREVTFENQLEIKESARNVAVQNVEVEKVSEIDPEKKGAYPPSKPKRGTKKGGKKTTNGNKEQVQEKLKYEEQMRLLKEKEIEQQRAREAALAKQKILEQEKEKYKEDEEEAKKKEEEARKKLAEAKQKAKEEREAKRLADAEKRRQLVEQRREERRQKDLELAEKEKEANRLRFEREARAQELKEQRQRLEEQEKLEEEQMLKNEKLEELKREEEEKRLEEERIKKAQEELERLVEEREYREQLRRVAEAQELKMREAEEQRRLQEEKEQQKIAEERERIKRIEYLKLQAELERQKEAENLADERRQIMLLKAAKRKTELIKRREENLERMSSLKSTRHSQSISRSFTFTYFVHIPRSVWEMPIGWNSKTAKGGRGGKSRPFSVTTTTRGSK